MSKGDILEYWLPIAHWIYDFQTLITGVLAIVAAAITIWQVRTQIANSQKAREEDQALADKASLTTLFLKVFLIADHVGRSYRHMIQLEKQFPSVKEEDLWQIFQPTIRDNGPKFRIDPAELRVLAKLKKGDLIQPIVELDRISGMDLDFINHYERLRNEFTLLVKDLVNYNFSEEGAQGSAVLNELDSPEAVRVLIETRGVLRKYRAFLSSSFDCAKVLMDDITQVSKEYKLPIGFQIPEKSEIVRTAAENTNGQQE